VRWRGLHNLVTRANCFVGRICYGGKSSYVVVILLLQLSNGSQFIVVSAVIGGLFAPTGQALEIAGPGGTLIAIVVNGIVAISVMECISEFTQIFPTPNAIVDIVSAFVDEDLAWVIGIAYWYNRTDICGLLTIRLTPEKVHICLHFRKSTC
jgi:hypothetical protein